MYSGQADVITNSSTSTYIGLASNSFKERYNNHLTTFKNKNKAESTTLSKYIWQLKSEKINYDLKWSIIGQASAYNNISKKCQLCLLEKTAILISNHSKPLNKRTEIMNTCRHRKKYLLSSIGSAVWDKNIFFGCFIFFECINFFKILQSLFENLQIQLKLFLKCCRRLW